MKLKTLRTIFLLKSWNPVKPDLVFVSFRISEEARGKVTNKQGSTWDHLPRDRQQKKIFQKERQKSEH